MEIQDYPNYLIYEDGRVWSKYKNIFLKTDVNTTGYLRVCLRNGKNKRMFIHRLIAIHYIPNPDNKPCVDHIDHNTQNNNISNLRWVTIRENSSNRTDQNEYIGVYKKGDKYQAVIYIDGTLKHLGIYDTPQDASDAYQKALEEINKGLPISYKPIPPKSGYIGVTQNRNKYRARLTIDGKNKHLGTFDTPELANLAIQEFLK